MNMNSNIIKNVLILLLVLLNSSAIAGDYYFGVKLADVNPAIDGQDINTSRTYKYKNISTIGGVFGYKLDDNLSIEGDITTNLSPGKIGKGAADPGNENLKWNMTTVSVHGLYKTSGSVHARIKAGLTNIMLTDPANFSVNSWYPDNGATTFSYGAGVGFITSSGKEVFIEFLRLSDRFTSVSFGFNF